MAPCSPLSCSLKGLTDRDFDPEADVQPQVLFYENSRFSLLNLPTL